MNSVIRISPELAARDLLRTNSLEAAVAISERGLVDAIYLGLQSSAAHWTSVLDELAECAFVGEAMHARTKRKKRGRTCPAPPPSRAAEA